MNVIELIRSWVRRYFRGIARFLHHASGGKVTPDSVTWTGLVAHIPISIMIALRVDYALAAVLLVVFGLLDVLDGELARLQSRASEHGMLLDATTDRFKEVLLYSGAAWALAHGNQPGLAAWAVGAAGASICVSYVKAKGEMAMAAKQSGLTHGQLNQIFRKEGLLPFELRMAVLVVALLTNQLAIGLIVITVGSTFTALQRLTAISKALEQ